MVRKLCIAVLFILFCHQGVSNVAYADNVAVLPKGISMFNMNYEHTLPADHRYSGNGGKGGDVEDIATDYNAEVGPNLFPLLNDLKLAFPAGGGDAC